MSDFKPIVSSLLIIFVLGIILNVTVAPFVDATDVQGDSVLSGLVVFIANGVTIDPPILGSINISPVTWLWFDINPVTDFIVEQLIILTYIPNVIALPIFIIIIMAFGFIFINIIKDLIPFT